ncbi:MAG: PEP-utilizing enzyme [Acidobacteria bacterium]|nr:PEP-utilizing enzyme [Acidobacteriota bacterium]
MDQISATTASFVRPLDTRDDDLDLLGGKGRSLARAANAGFAVPGGFQVTTAAYRSFVAANGLQRRIVELAKPELVNGAASFDRASAAIQELLAAPALSDLASAEIAAAYRSLEPANPPVAVRSSANAEDLPEASFAGQQDTYLNVRGEDAVVAAVRDCWASLWTPRAIAYRHQMGIDQGKVAMAVVVQIMVPSEISGILFTANPATGERSEAIVNASFGLGEAVVGGQVTPDTYVVDRATGEATETIIGTKEQRIVQDGDQGTRLEETCEADRGRSSLSPEAIRELVELGGAVEAQFDGVPQDIEWAISGGKLYLLQSRPITNLPPQPIEVEWEPTPPARILTRRQIVENMPDPICPLFEELYLTVGLEKARKGKSMMVGGGPVFVTMHGFAYQRGDWQMLFPDGKNREIRKPTEDELEAAERAMAERRRDSPAENLEMAKHDLKLFRDALSDEDGRAFDAWAASAGLGESLAQRVTMPESRNPTYIAFNRTQWNEGVLRKWREETMPRLVRITGEWREVDPATASDETLLKGIHDLGVAEGDYWSNDTGHTFGVAKSTDDQLQCFLRETLPDHHFTSGQFLSGFKSKTMEANDAIYEVARRIRADDSLWELVMVTPASRLMAALGEHPASGPALEAIGDYLQTFGHQGYTLDFVEPPQSEDPTAFFATLKTMVANRDYSPEQHDIDARAKKEKALVEIEGLLDGLAYWQFRFRLWFTYLFYPIREETMFYLGSAWPVLRPLAAELGRRLVDAGSFTRPDDIYFCVTDEIREAIAARARGEARPDLGVIAAERRELREARKRLHPPGTVPPEASEHPSIAFKETQARNDPNSSTLRGVPVSPGTVTAPASLIKSPPEFDRMRSGSILVCPMTNPAWTPLFAHASGLVTDIGGILGHGSIVAREYGIPAVVGTGTITQRVVSGQEISVDGDAGVVTLHEES